MPRRMFLRTFSLWGSSNWYRQSLNCMCRYLVLSSSMFTQLGISPRPSRGNIVSSGFSSHPANEDLDGSATLTSMALKMVPGELGWKQVRSGDRDRDREWRSPEYDAGVTPLPPPGETRRSSKGQLDGPAPVGSSGRAEGMYIESRRACLNAAEVCCCEKVEAFSASSARLRQ